FLRTMLQISDHIAPAPYAINPELVKYPIDPTPARSALASDDPLALQPSASKPCDCRGLSTANRTGLVFQRPASTPPSRLRSTPHRPIAHRRLRWSHHRKSQSGPGIDPTRESIDAGCHPRAASSPSVAGVDAFCGAVPASRIAGPIPHSAVLS